MARGQLLDLLVRHSYQYEAKPVFQLTSGRMSRFYVNCKATTMRREAAPLIAATFEPHIPASAKAIGGLTLGADPIAYAVRDLAKHPLDAFVVRKFAKEHGLRKAIEGPVTKGLAVIVVDDVVTTGGSTLQAIEACHDADLEIVAVLVLVDRMEDEGMARIKNAAGNVPVSAMFTRDQLHEHWLQSSAAR